MTIRVQRIYEPRDNSKDVRILVDRLWPRGLSKAEADFDHWLKDIAPSTALRNWFGHELSRWAAFKKRYFGELEANPQAVAELRRIAGNRTVTLLYSAHDRDHNQAVALRNYLLQTNSSTRGYSRSGGTPSKRRRSSRK